MRDLKIYLSIASVLLIIYLVAQYNRPVPVSWAQTLADKDKIPYGTYILYHRLNDIFPAARVQAFRDPVYNAIDERTGDSSTYVIVCNDLNVTQTDFEQLTRFIKQGNDVFISASAFGDYLENNLKIEVSDEGMERRSAGAIHFFGKGIDTTKNYAIDKPINDGYFSKFDTTKAIVLAQNKLNHACFVKYPMGKGALYLNANPLMFSNYSMLNEQGLAYVSNTMSYLQSRNNLLWDEYYTAGREDEASPMRVFLRNASLRWGYYIALFSMIIFILYQVKRRQRIIPVIEPLSNSTLDFVNVVGQVYYEQRDNSNIAQKKAAYFLEHIRAKYNVKTTLLDDEFRITLSNKSGVSADLIQEIISEMIMIRSGQPVSDSQLISLNKNIEQFYLQSR